MFDATKWSEARVVWRRDWGAGLWSFRLDAAESFKPGQFVTLGLPLDGREVKRAYSIASAPDEPLEFFVVEVAEGALTPSLYRLPVGGVVYVRRRITGRFTVDRIDGGRALWLVSTGTGLAPYISMLRDGEVQERFDQVIVVHGARHAEHLAYAEELQQFEATSNVRYLPSLTRERVEGVLRGRITDLLRDGELEAAASRRLSPDEDRVMLCGNPAMVDEMLDLLSTRGLGLHTPRAPGAVFTESYW